MNKGESTPCHDIDGSAASGPESGKGKPDGRKGAVMARPGNQNAVKHGAYARSNMSELHKKKHAVVAARDKYREEAEKEAAEVLKAYGLTDDPLAGIVGRGLARLEALVHRLEQLSRSRYRLNFQAGVPITPSSISATPQTRPQEHIPGCGKVLEMACC